MKNLSKVAGVSLAAALLVACSNVATIPHNYVSEGYKPNYLNYTAGRGGMFTEVVGNPFDIPQDQLDSAVTTSLEDHHFGPELPFFTQPPEGFSSPYKVVVLFNAAPGASPSRLCENPDQPRSTETGDLRVLAAFCLDGYRISSSGGWISGASGPDDPRFETLMRQISLLLFPSVPTDPGANDGIRRAG